MGHMLLSPHTQSTSTPFPPLRSISVTRTGKYYYNLKSNDDDNEVSTYVVDSLGQILMYLNVC